MAQIRSGSAYSLVGSRDANVIEGGNNNDWADVSVGSMFMFTGDEVSYFVGSTVSPSISSSGKWELLLTSDYVGTQKVGANYAIHSDFEPNNNLPLLRSGDVETGIIFSRAMARIGELLTTGLILEGTYTAAVNDYPLDTSGTMTAYTAKRSYWIVSTGNGSNLEVGGKVVWNGGVAGSHSSADWYYIAPDAAYIPASHIVTSMIDDEAVTTAKLSTSLQDSITVADALHYKGEFSPSGASYPSTAGLIDYDYYIANDNGTVSGTVYKKGDWARYDTDTVGWSKEPQYAPYGTPYTYMGKWDASGNTAPSAPNEYEAWRITAAGTFGGVNWSIDDIAVYINSAWSLYPKPSDITLYNTTTSATQTELFLDGSTSRLSIASDTTWGYDIMVVARRTDGNNESAFYKFEGCIDNNAGVTAVVGQVAATPIEDTGASTWACVVNADNTNDALRIQVTGQASETIKWTASVRLVEANG